MTVLPGRRRLDPQWVEALSDLFASQGQLAPVDLVKIDGGYRLIAGHHRLAAGRLLGWHDIIAFVTLPEDLQSQSELVLREITENMARRELSVLDRAFDIARWRALYEAASGPIKRGRRKLSQVATIEDDEAERFSESFSEAARRTLGLTRDAVSRAMRIAGLSDAIRDRLALHPIADNQSELLQLADQPVARRADIAALLTSEPAQASTVAGAIALLDGRPADPSPERWQKLSASFAALKRPEQHAFFALHEDAIRDWLEARAG